MASTECTAIVKDDSDQTWATAKNLVVTFSGDTKRFYVKSSDSCLPPSSPPSLPPSSPPPSPPPTPPPAPPIQPVENRQSGACDTFLTELECRTVAENRGLSFQLTSNEYAPKGCVQYSFSGQDPYVTFQTVGGGACFGVAECICGFTSPPTPPSPPPSPPPLSPPPAPPAPPPSPPLLCSSMAGRQNTRLMGETGKWCTEIRTINENTCEGYFSLTPAGNMRLCYNPIAPATNNTVYCAASDIVTGCDALPPSPPPSPQWFIGQDNTDCDTTCSSAMLACDIDEYRTRIVDVQGSLSNMQTVVRGALGDPTWTCDASVSNAASNNMVPRIKPTIERCVYPDSTMDMSLLSCTALPQLGWRKLCYCSYRSPPAAPPPPESGRRLSFVKAARRARLRGLMDDEP